MFHGPVRVFSSHSLSHTHFVVSVCICVCLHGCIFAYEHKYMYACTYYVCMHVCIYIYTDVHKCMHLHMHICVFTFKPSSGLMVLKSRKLSIYKKMVVFSVFLPENYLDEVATWGSKSDEVDSCRGYSSWHILKVGPLSDAWVTDIFPSVCLLLNFLESLFGGSGRRVQLLLCPGLTATSPLLGEDHSLWPTDWLTDQQSGQLQEEWEREGTPT